ncbi:hypothetical protein [Hyphomonas pacifica]|uniref:Uncharacterized protein n=1 Tax=Hyphomonas pacifica TaxID=1280941 RepID=A0A062TWD0_9PROT|nr:hypothetical protein [Hyphomonas pacifica]KCZ50342.1 hypothetical protein HY2_14435 [Hyphomonas pacifica]RAN32615.1 hypothetical protein HY3_14915 [Hyphomonas pacifica]
MTYNFFALLAGVILFIGAAAAEPPTEEANDLLYACEASYALQGAKMDPRWCQCQSAYYRKLMTTADWRRYSRDFFALRDLQDSNAPTAENSYARGMQIGRDHCAACNQNGYQGCLANTVDPTQEQREIVNAIAHGAFGKVSRNIAYKQMFTRYIEAYSRQCRSQITSGKLIIREYSSRNGPTERVEVAVEHPFVESYKAYGRADSDAVTADAVRVLGDILTSDNPFDQTPTINMGQRLAGLDNDMNEIVRECRSDFGKALHENLRRFDAGEAPVKMLAASASSAMSATSRRQMIQEAMAEAYERAKKRWAAADAKRASQEELRAGLTCSSEKWNLPDSSRARVANEYGSYVGGWRGTLLGGEAELLTWGTMDMYGQLAGLIYFPDKACLMAAEFKNDSTPRDAVKLQVVKARSLISQCTDALNLPANVDEKRYNLGGQFYLEPTSTGQRMTLALGTMSPGYRAVNNMGFDGTCETQSAFSKAPVSSAMVDRISAEKAAAGRHHPGWLPPRQVIEQLTAGR